MKTHCKVYPPDAPVWVCRPNTGKVLKNWVEKERKKERKRVLAKCELEQCYRNRSLCAGKTKKLGDKDINSNYKGCAKIKTQMYENEQSLATKKF